MEHSFATMEHNDKRDDPSSERKPVVSILKNAGSSSHGSVDHATKSYTGHSVLEPSTRYEGNRPSTIRSNSYTEDVRSSTVCSMSTDSSADSPIDSNEQVPKDHKKTGLQRMAKYRKMLLRKYWTKSGALRAVEQAEDRYETHEVPVMSKKDREKHKKFFSQLDFADAKNDVDDGTVATAECQLPEDMNQLESKTNAVEQSVGATTLTRNQSPSNKSVDAILNDAGVETFPRFLERILNCGCTGFGGTDNHLTYESHKKEVRINPVATVCNSTN